MQRGLEAEVSRCVHGSSRGSLQRNNRYESHGRWALHALNDPMLCVLAGVATVKPTKQ